MNDNFSCGNKPREPYMARIIASLIQRNQELRGRIEELETRMSLLKNIALILANGVIKNHDEQAS